MEHTLTKNQGSQVKTTKHTCRLIIGSYQTATTPYKSNKFKIS